MSAISNSGNNSVPNEALQVYTEVQRIPPCQIKSLIRDYVPECFNPLVNFINLSDPKILKNHLQNENDLPKALVIAKKIYECGARFINGSNFGRAFPMNPEVLAYAMQSVKNGNVLEIAGASGENAILLAFSGAKQVYVNDIDTEEMRKFRGLLSQLPQAISAKLKPIEGNCFDILEKEPNIKNKIDLVLCRNLIHFFNDEQQAKLFKLLKNVLKPDGKAIFVANTLYRSPNAKEMFKKDPDATSFTMTACFIDDCFLNSQEVIFQHYSPCPRSLVGLAYKKQYLYEKKLTGELQVNKDEFNSLDVSVRPLIKQACKEYKAGINQMVAGTVRVLTTHLGVYTKENLTKLFESRGFDVMPPFALNEEGHLVDDDHLFSDAAHVGVIVKAPSA